MPAGLTARAFPRKKNALIIAALAMSLTFSAAVAGSQESANETLTDLRQRGQQEGWTFTVGLNPVVERSLEQLCGFIPDTTRVFGTPRAFLPSSEPLPATFDWRALGGCAPIRDQGQCGSCWAFATVGPLESAIRIKDGVEVDLSEQWLVSCTYGGMGCFGGDHGFESFMPNPQYPTWQADPCGHTGAVLEEDFPYAAANLPCNCPYEHVYYLESWSWISNRVEISAPELIKAAILEYGPISVGMGVDTPFAWYTGGVFNECDDPMIGAHAVVLVGWDDYQGSDGIWVLRNSWGGDWGEDGYCRIERGCLQVGCDAAYVVYAGGPSLDFNYPDGIPDFVMQSTPDTIAVNVVGVNGGAKRFGTGLLHYSVNHAPYQTLPFHGDIMGQEEYAVLPATACGDRIEFYFSYMMSPSERLYDPDPDHPFVAIAVKGVLPVLHDDFESDQGWLSSGNASAGQWERGVPAGEGDCGQPPTDADSSGSCFLTGNAGGDSDVDDGAAYLESPLFDLSEGEGRISYYRWYSNWFGTAPREDVIRTFLSNDGGQTWVVTDTAGPIDLAMGGWHERTFLTGDYLIPTGAMKLRFEVSDAGDSSMIEAGIDGVRIDAYSCVHTTPLQLLTTHLPDWTAGHDFSQQLVAIGGTGIHAWADKYGELAGTGLTLATGGNLSGIPATESDITFTAAVSDELDEHDEQFLTMHVNPAIAILIDSCPEWTAGQPYETSLAASGGTGNLVFSDQDADLDGTGLAISAEGVISGIAVQSGLVTFTATVTDVVGAVDDRVFQIVINPPVEIISQSSDLPAAGDGEPYAFQLLAAGGTGALSWTNPDGELSGTGLTLSTSGLLQGVPDTIGTLTFLIMVSDTTGSNDATSLEVACLDTWMCGDCNRDEKVNLSDITILIDYVYLAGDDPDPLEAGNVNASLDGRINLSDITRVIDFVYLGGEDLQCLY